MKRGAWLCALALGGAFVSAGCKQQKSEQQQTAASGELDRAEQAQQQSEQALKQAQQAQEKASAQQEEVSKAQEEVTTRQTELQEAQRQADQEQQQAQEAQQQARQQSKQASEQAEQSQQEALSAQQQAEQQAQQQQQQQQQQANGTSGGSQTAMGTVDSVREGQVVIERQGAPELVLRVDEQTPVLIEGQEGDVMALSVGAPVRIEYRLEQNEPVAERIEQMSGEPATRQGRRAR